MDEIMIHYASIIMNPPTCPLVHLATCGMIPFIEHDYASNGSIMNHDFIYALTHVFHSFNTLLRVKKNVKKFIF